MPARAMSRTRAARARRDLEIVLRLLAEGERALAAAHAERARRWLDRDGTLPLDCASAQRYAAAFAVLADARPAEQAA